MEPCPPAPPAQGSHTARVWGMYAQTTPARLRLVDAYIVFALLSGAVQLAFHLAAASALRAMLAAFISAVGSFVFAGDTFGRMQPSRHRTLAILPTPQRVWSWIVYTEHAWHFRTS
jgi:oligosaccharyltransferase complex subunit epsilon